MALSRATSLEGLQILGFSKAKVMAHPKVSPMLSDDPESAGELMGIQVKEWSRTLITTRNTSAVDDNE